MVVDPWHKDPNEAERANCDINDDYKLIRPFALHGLYKRNWAL